MSTKMYVFGYGSLVVPEDVYRTLGREIVVLYPYTLTGWLRDWSVIVDNTRAGRRFGLANGSLPPHVAALNVRPPQAGEVATNPNGVLFEVTKGDIALLDGRESHYERVDVTDCISNPPGIVYTYTGLPEHTAVHEDERPIIVPASYAELVQTGFTTLGAEHEYRQTTLAHPWQLADTTILTS